MSLRYFSNPFSPSLSLSLLLFLFTHQMFSLHDICYCALLHQCSSRCFWWFCHSVGLYHGIHGVNLVSSDRLLPSATRSSSRDRVSRVITWWTWSRDRSSLSTFVPICGQMRSFSAEYIPVIFHVFSAGLQRCWLLVWFDFLYYCLSRTKQTLVVPVSLRWQLKILVLHPHHQLSLRFFTELFRRNFFEIGHFLRLFWNIPCSRLVGGAVLVKTNVQNGRQDVIREVGLRKLFFAHVPSSAEWFFFSRYLATDPVPTVGLTSIRDYSSNPQNLKINLKYWIFTYTLFDQPISVMSMNKNFLRDVIGSKRFKIQNAGLQTLL